MNISLLVALASVAVSIWTLFVTQLSAARITVELGPILKFYHPRDGGFAAYVPLTFVNFGARVGVVSRIVLTLSPSGHEQRYEMEWSSFSRYDGANWVYDSIVHPLPVDGHGAQHKLVWFSWQASSRPELNLTAGNLDCEVRCWVSGRSFPLVARRRLTISKEQQQRLDEWRAANNAATVEVRTDGVERNRVEKSKARR
ncbi:MAG: hypothetical protein HY054_09595 [Proteobacteria bacterium]|nr:hypothetical protein [Pseudomonadota bacterium]